MGERKIRRETGVAQRDRERETVAVAGERKIEIGRKTRIRER